MTDPHSQIVRTAVEAASAPAFKASAAGAGLAIGADWVSATGANTVALAGLVLTAATFVVNAWSIWRRDRREQEAHRVRMAAAALDPQAQDQH